MKDRFLNGNNSVSPIQEMVQREQAMVFPVLKTAAFLARFPFAAIDLNDDDIPLDVSIKGWSPFIPTDADNSSLPAGAIEYSFKNTGNSRVEAVFSYNSRNFMSNRTAKQ